MEGPAQDCITKLGQTAFFLCYESSVPRMGEDGRMGREG